MRLSFLAAAILLFPLSSLAQMDLSSEILLRPTEKSSPKEAGLESGRYKVKKQKTLPGKKVNGTEVDANAMAENTTAVVLPAGTQTTMPAPTPKRSAETKSEIDQLLFTPSPTASNPKPVDKPVESVETKEAPVEPTVTDQVRDLVMGNEQATLEAYKEQVHPDDIRMNRIEVNVLPGVVSNNSDSSYSFRDYNSFSPKLLFGANIWVTPFIGAFGSYSTTMGADVGGDASSNSRISVRHEWTEIGFTIRKFFGMSRKSNSLELGLLMSEYKFSVPGDDTSRVRLRSSGVGLHMLSRIPVAPSYSWVFGGKLIPRVQHSEMATALVLSSGSVGESSRVDLSVGGEFKMARQNQIVWDLTTAYEKNQFNGQADTTDPTTGSKPSGVSVSNTFVIFSLGYRWGQ